MHLYLIVFILSVVSGLPLAQTQPLATPSCQELNQLWLSRYHGEFGVQTKRENFSCPSIESRLARAFYQLESIAFPAGKDGRRADFYSWAQRLIRKIIIIDHYYEPFPEVMILGSRSLKTLYIYKPVAENSCDYCLLQILLHETRHLEPDSDDHSLCVRGHFKDQLACDQQLFLRGHAGGGYNMGFRYLLHIYRYALNSPFDRHKLYSQLQFMLDNHFNEVTTDQQIWFESLQ